MQSKLARSDCQAASIPPQTLFEADPNEDELQIADCRWRDRLPHTEQLPARQRIRGFARDRTGLNATWRAIELLRFKSLGPCQRAGRHSGFPPDLGFGRDRLVSGTPVDDRGNLLDDLERLRVSRIEQPAGRRQFSLGRPPAIVVHRGRRRGSRCGFDRWRKLR